MFCGIDLNLPEMSCLKNVNISCGTNNIFIDSLYDIAQCSIDIGVSFRNCSPKIKIFIPGILPTDECYSVNRILIKEINTILKCKCAFHRFNFIEKEQGWTDNNDALDPSLFYQDKLHLIQKGNIKLSESIITTTKDANIGQNTLFNEMRKKKHNQFMKTYKMGASFNLNHADFLPLLNSTVFKPVSSVSSSISCTTASRSFSNKVNVLSFKSLTKASNKSFPRATGNFAPKHLHNPSQSFVFDLARNVPTKYKHYVICKSDVPFESVAVNVNFAPVSVFNVLM